MTHNPITYGPIIGALSVLCVAGPVRGQATPPAPQAEATALAAQTGAWRVTDAFWITPGAAPQVTRGLIADRRMVGSQLEETLHDANATTSLRIDYLGYDETAGQWNYVSVEGRIPVALMKATSEGRDAPARITLQFDPFASPPISPAWNGRLLRMEEVITHDSADHETKDQYFTLADGTGKRWLAHRYEYRRLR